MAKIRKQYSPGFKLKAVIEVLKKEKTASQIAGELEVHPLVFTDWKKHFLKSGSQIFEKPRKASKVNDESKEKTEFFEQIGRLKMELEWLKKMESFDLAKRRLLINPKNANLSLRTQCQFLRISRSGLYYEPKKSNEEDLLLMRAIDEQYLKTLFYGRRRMTIEMQKFGFLVGQKRVRTAMRRMGLEAIYPQPNLSASKNEHKKYPFYKNAGSKWDAYQHG